MNKYIDMFSFYSVLKSLFNKEQSLSKEQLLTIDRNIQIYLNSDDSDDGTDDGSNSGSLDIDNESSNKQTKIDNQFISLLEKYLKKIKNSKEKSKLTNLINKLKKHLKEIQESFEDKFKKEEIKEKIEAIDDSNNTPDPAKAYEIYSKFKDLQEFGFNKALNKDYFPTKNPTINVSNFEKLSRNELVEMFSAENFYKLSKKQVLELFQATANEFLSANNVSSCAVIPEDLPYTNKHVVFGQYSANSGAIYLNSNLIDSIENAKDSQNQALPYLILETIIHEAEHRVQFSKLDEKYLSEKDKIINNSLTRPRNTKFSEYLIAPEELDARDTALQYFREVSSETNNESLKAFYNAQKQREMNYQKHSIISKNQQYFQDIYNKQLLNTNQTLNTNIFTIMNASNPELNR